MATYYHSIDDYITGFPPEKQERLHLIRETIIKNAPGATESIAYGIPAYKTEGKPLVYFGGFEKHIGLYATPTGHDKFKKELSAYKQGKGSVQFPDNKPLPLDLISEIIKFRVEENSRNLK